MKRNFTIQILLIAFLSVASITLLAQTTLPDPPANKVWSLTTSGTYCSGPTNTGAGSGDTTIDCGAGAVPTDCGSVDTSFGLDNQCAASTVTVVGTPGANFIQHQIFGDIGTSDNGLAGLAVPCNPGVGGTGANANWPSSAQETRRITLTNWLNPDTDASDGTICIPTSARLDFLDTAVGDGTGAGGDELRFTVIGGTSGECTTFGIEYTYDLAVAISGAYSSLSGTIIPTQTISQTLSNVPNAGGGAYNATDDQLHSSGCGSIQTSVASWYFPGGTNTAAVGTGYTASNDVYTLIDETGSTFNLDFTSAQSITTSQISGNADGRATAGPGFGGKVKLTVEWECYELEDLVPVTLTLFEGRQTSPRNVELNWATASETNAAHFEIERSINGQRYEAIGKVDAAGNSAEFNTYTFNDNTIDSRAEEYMYRLKMVDLDGTTDYSDVISIELSINRPVVTISPNPTKGDIILETKNFGGTINFAVFNTQGARVHHQVINGNSNIHNLDIGNLAKGLYMVQLSNGTNNITRKIILE